MSSLGKDEHEKLIAQLQNAIDKIQDVVKNTDFNEKDDLTVSLLPLWCMKNAYKDRLLSANIIKQKLCQYKYPPIGILSNYYRLKRAARSIIDFEKGVGNWISTSDKNIWEKFILSLLKSYPQCFHLIENKMRYPIIEYLIKVPREATSILSKQDVNEFTDLLFEYTIEQNVFFAQEIPDTIYLNEAFSFKCDGNRILKFMKKDLNLYLVHNNNVNLYEVNFNNEDLISQLVENITDENWKNNDNSEVKMQKYIENGEFLLIYRTGQKECMVLTHIVSVDDIHNKLIEYCKKLSQYQEDSDIFSEIVKIEKF